MMVEVGVKVGVLVEVAVCVGVAVAWATVAVAPETGMPLNKTGWPLLPLAPVTLKLKVPLAPTPKSADIV